LEEVKLEGKDKRSRSDVLSEMEERDYRALVGQLNWIATQTRPDISFDVCELSSVFDKALVDNFVHANKAVKKAQSCSVVVQYPELCNQNHLTIECYSDASFGNLEDSGSQRGHVIFIVDSDGIDIVDAHFIGVAWTWQSKQL
jgi:hypothetical protein